MKISTRELVMAALFTALMCVVTILVRVFQPVVIIPFSLQPFIMLLAACILSPNAAFLSMLAYMLLGLIGMPVFSSPPYGGIAYVLKPSFGFILAFPAAAWVQSKLIRRTNLTNFLAAGIIGVAILYIIGLPYMYVILNLYMGKALNVMQVLKIGFFPFITFDLLKVVVAAFLAVELSRRMDLKREFDNE
ncbi:biotin transporter BioY [Thermosyntropha sp.]|uniref:biotin transporter BioY n=1 Tax=Thermosyntropha sp. TaxID=2740820 RepID=UPI0025EFC7E0|nr:biotin transporter BioY [Thermosyntropha sp.]MBO8159743.1 biotin transporter BioY [Thermosyntropha sp.]